MTTQPLSLVSPSLTIPGGTAANAAKGDAGVGAGGLAQAVHGLLRRVDGGRRAWRAARDRRRVERALESADPAAGPLVVGSPSLPADDLSPLAALARAGVPPIALRLTARPQALDRHVPCLARLDRHHALEIDLVVPAQAPLARGRSWAEALRTVERLADAGLAVRLLLTPGPTPDDPPRVAAATATVVTDAGRAGAVDVAWSGEHRGAGRVWKRALELERLRHGLGPSSRKSWAARS